MWVTGWPGTPTASPGARCLRRPCGSSRASCGAVSSGNASRCCSGDSPPAVTRLLRPWRGLERHVVDVAIAPVLAGLEAAHDGMSGLMKVPGRVAIGGIVATADVTALQTEPEVHPPVAGLQALFAAPGRLRRDVAHLDEMLASLGHHVAESLLASR